MIDDLFDNDELNDKMSREEMREIINLQKKNRDLSVKLDTAIQKQHELKDRLHNKQPGRFPDFVEHVRHESAALSYRIDLNVDDMRAMFINLVTQEGLLKGKDAEARLNMDIAYTSLYHCLNGAMGRAYTLLAEMRSQLDETVTGPVTDNNVLFDDKEALMAARYRELLLIEHDHDKLMRESKKPRRSRKA